MATRPIYIGSRDLNVGVRSARRTASLRQALNATYRSLARLRESGSTSRVFNLNRIWEVRREEPDYAAKPFFDNLDLNRSLLIRHKIRKEEVELFPDFRPTAIKVVLPFAAEDLRIGGQAFFVGEKSYDQAMADVAPATGLGPRDRLVLESIDNLPSLDPFLVRERLKMVGVAPARCYFEISDADIARMQAFTEAEMTPLFRVALGDQANPERLARLARRVIGAGEGESLEPLRVGLGLEPAQFDESLFAWRGFLYYKWCLITLGPQIRPFLKLISEARAYGPTNAVERKIFAETRPALVRAVARTSNEVRDLLRGYDDAYAAFTGAARPGEFRKFLIEAPELFWSLGEKIGALNHLVSYWGYLYPRGPTARTPPAELAETLRDFFIIVGEAAETDA